MTSRTFLLLLALFTWTSPGAAVEPTSEGGKTSTPLRPRLDRPHAHPASQDAPPEGKQASRPETVPEPPPPQRELAPSRAIEVESKLDAAPTPPRKVWYGWQNLAVDGTGQTLGLALGVLTANGDGGLIGLTTGVATYALGGPIVHFFHGNVGKGFGSLGLRVGLPPAAAFAGFFIERRTCEGELFCGLAGGLLGLAAGTVSAIALDASVLAYKTVPSETKARQAGLHSVVVLPHLSPETAGLSVNAAF